MHTDDVPITWRYWWSYVRCLDYIGDGIRHCGQWQGHWCQTLLYIVDAYYEHLGTGCYAIVDLYHDDVDCSGVCQQDMDLYFMVDALQDAYWDVMQHHLWLMPVVALGLPSMHWWGDLSHWCIMFQMLYMWFCTCYLCMIDRVMPWVSVHGLMPFDAMIGWYISLLWWHGIWTVTSHWLGDLQDSVLCSNWMDEWFFMHVRWLFQQSFDALVYRHFGMVLYAYAVMVSCHWVMVCTMFYSVVLQGYMLCSGIDEVWPWDPQHGHVVMHPLMWIVSLMHCVQWISLPMYQHDSAYMWCHSVDAWISVSIMCYCGWDHASGSCLMDAMPWYACGD